MKAEDALGKTGFTSAIRTDPHYQTVRTLPIGRLVACSVRELKALSMPETMIMVFVWKGRGVMLTREDVARMG